MDVGTTETNETLSKNNVDQSYDEINPSDLMVEPTESDVMRKAEMGSEAAEMDCKNADGDRKESEEHFKEPGLGNQEYHGLKNLQTPGETYLERANLEPEEPIDSTKIANGNDAKHGAENETNIAEDVVENSMDDKKLDGEDVYKAVINEQQTVVRNMEVENAECTLVDDSRECEASKNNGECFVEKNVEKTETEIVRKEINESEEITVEEASTADGAVNKNAFEMKCNEEKVNLSTSNQFNSNQSAENAQSAVKDSDVQTDAKSQVENEWLDILGNGLLKKKVITQGKGAMTRPKSGNVIKMVVNAVLMDGTKLEEETVEYIHDDRETIQAFELAVALMEEGEKSLLYTDSKYAYGTYGCDVPKVPRNCNITYTLELLSVSEGPAKDTMTDEKRIEIGDKKRELGNRLYSRGDFGGAIEVYKRAFKYLDGSAGQGVIDMKVKCQNNLSAAQLKVNAFQAALQSCNTVLTLQAGNVKAIFRKSKCLEALGKQDEALKCLKEASMLDPKNRMIYNELTRLSKYVKESRQKESDMYKRMVDGLKKGDEAKGEDDYNSLSFKLMVGTLVVAGIGLLAAFIWNRH